MTRQNLPITFRTPIIRKIDETLTIASDSGVLSGQKWNTKLRELSKQGHYTQALILYREMLRSAAAPNAFTFPFVLKSSSALEIPISGKSIHCHVVKSGCRSEPFVQTALISMYCRFRSTAAARNLFDEIPESSRPTVCYNAFISGLVHRKKLIEALDLLREMMLNRVHINGVTILGLIVGCNLPSHLTLGMSLHSLIQTHGLITDSAVGNSLCSMYLRCGSLDFAWNLFDEMPLKNLITWNTMITGYSQNGLGKEALELYRKMRSLRINPDEVTLVGVLSSCANLGAQRIGREIEDEIENFGYCSNPFLKNSLISMYSRCGNLERARTVFDSMAEKNLVSWTAMISGYGIHGHGETAAELFDDMVAAKIQPDGAAFVSVLTACSHAGLTQKGLDYFYSMEEMYRLTPASEHYACIVDLLGRAGRLMDARRFIELMPIQPDGPVWGALLGACKIHKNVSLAEVAFDKVVQLEPTNIGYFVLLSNLYSETGDKDGVLRIRVLLQKLGLKKDAGYSYVEHERKIHLFVAGDRAHPMAKNIYATLQKLEALRAEYRNKNDNEKGNENETQQDRAVHSEKLAIAFAVMNAESKKNSDILIIKNLRICSDCHAFVKEVSRFIEQRFVVRDSTRFHHFRNGTCSCNDYW